MSATRGKIAWLIPGILLCGGCAASALRTASAPIDPSTDATAEASSTAEASESAPNQDHQDKTVSPMVSAEAALIRRMALENGHSEAEAARIEQSVLRAQPQDRDFLTRFIYAQLNREQTPDSAPQASRVDSGQRPSSVPADAYLVSPTTSARDVTPAAQSVIAAAFAQPQTDSITGSPAVSPPAPTSTQGTTTPDAAAQPAGEALPDTLDSRENDPPNHQASKPQAQAHAPELTSSPPAVAANQQATLGNMTEETTAEVASQPDISWQKQLRAAITHLRGELREREDLDPLDESRMRASLGLLQLAAHDPERAMEALEGMDDQQLEFWRQTILGLGILIDADELPKMRHRVASASEHLESGLSALGSLGPLRVANLAFANDVRSFGVYDEISSRRFEPGEETILYVELGNFSVEQIQAPDRNSTSSHRRGGGVVDAPMYEAELQARYDILDENQRVVLSRTLPMIRDRCRQQRHDFFVAHPFYMPKFAAGSYTLELTVEDRKGGKFGASSIDFRIR